MKKTGGIFHDRFIVLDYGTADEYVVTFIFLLKHYRL